MKRTKMLAAVVVPTIFVAAGRHVAAELIAGTASRVDPASSTVADFGAGTSQDHLELYFNYCTSFTADCDLALATRASTDDPFSAASLLDGNINSTANELYPTLSPDGLELIFTDSLLPPFDNNKRRPGGLGGGDLWRATRSTTDAPFGNVVNLGDLVNSTSLESYPSLSPDGLSLYFSSTRPGGQGGSDIYITTRAALGEPFGPPVNLGPSVNASSNEGRATVHPNNLAIVFDSDRSGGAGNYDLWLTERTSADDAWEPAENLATVNTSTLDSGPHFSADGSMLYFESFRSPNLGFGSDLWQVPTSAPTAPEPLAGDYNGNGQVEQADLDLVLLNWGADSATPPIGWTNSLPSGFIDQDDLDGVLLHWGDQRAAVAAKSVPEPTSLSLFVPLCLSLLLLRRVVVGINSDAGGLL